MVAAKKFGAFSYVGRNVMRRSLRSAITITGISVVITFFILFTSISQGLKDDIIGEIARFADHIINVKDGRVQDG
ncbi:MAG: hypothetical protein Q7J68_01855 [Thermoplasmata archaeon]|nr:hypothetical protein [Thermoplasmata archaeon]